MNRIYMLILGMLFLSINNSFGQKHTIKGESVYQRISISSVDDQRIDDVRLFTGSSDIDYPNLNMGKPNKNRYALIIGNEYYKYQNRVNFAVRDAETFVIYAHQAFLIPKENILAFNNLSYGELKRKIQLLVNFSKNNPEAELYFYYAGHGAPNNKGEAMLLGIDQNATNLQEELLIEEIYNHLLIYNPKRAVVFLDACFSGNSARTASEDDYLAQNTRAVRIKNVEKSYSGPLFVFSSSKNNQTSNAINDQGHGLFTYYLLKNILLSNGKINYATLVDKTKKNVGLQATRMQLIQEPSYRVGSAVENDWEYWYLHR